MNVYEILQLYHGRIVIFTIGTGYNTFTCTTDCVDDLGNNFLNMTVQEIWAELDEVTDEVALCIRV